MERELKSSRSWFAGEGYQKVFRDTISRVEHALPKNAGRLRVLLYSARSEFFDSADLINEKECGSALGTVVLCGNEEQLREINDRFDLAIICGHLFFEHKIAFIIRGKGLTNLIAMWTWDNHHLFAENLKCNMLADFVFPAHEYVSSYLKTPHCILGKHVPLCTAQWSRKLTSDILMANLELERDNSLYGGFVLWESERNALLFNIKSSTIPNNITLIPTDIRGEFFAKSRKERFEAQILYKVCLTLPLYNDLSLRVFDALIAGQIPIVPRWCHDLDVVVPPSVQRELPIVRLESATVDSVRASWELALKAFDAMGKEGVVKRHSFAKDNHHVSARLRDICNYISNFRSNETLMVVYDEPGIGLVTDRPEHAIPELSEIEHYNCG